jgi:hypothetical protein
MAFQTSSSIGGTSGQVLRSVLGTTGDGGVTWTTATPAAGQPLGTWSTGGFTQSASQQSIRVTGDAEFEGEVTIRGVKLDERLDVIEQRLGILRPNNDLEGRWEALKALGEEYRRLEKELLEGEQIWSTLKK